MRDGKVPINVYLDSAERQQLEDLSLRCKVPRSQIIRTALANYHRMIIVGIPTCASGMACFWPQMHAQPLPTVDLPGQMVIGAPPMPRPQISATNSNPDRAA